MVMNKKVKIYHSLRSWLNIFVPDVNRKENWSYTLRTCVCVYVCVCVTGHRSVGFVQIIRWWSSNPGKWPLRNLGSVAYCYVFILDLPHPLFPPSDVLPGGAPPSFPNTPSTNVCCVSEQDHPPTWDSPVSVPAYRCYRPYTYPSLSVLPPSDPPSLSPCLSDYHCRRTLAAYKISSNATFSCFYAAACFHHGTRIFQPPSYNVSLTQIFKIGHRATR